MKNIITERAQKVALTRSQMKIAEYFIQNTEKVGRSSSLEIAREIGVSDVSITRFARAIGYKGFTDLKNDLYNHMAKQAQDGMNELSLVERLDRNNAQSGGKITRSQYMKTLQYNLEQTFIQNDDKTFDAVVTALAEAEHCYIVGFRGCLGAATQFSALLQALVSHVIFISDEGPDGIGVMQGIGPRDCGLFFSVSRYYKSDLTLINLAKQRGAALCAITDSALSPIARAANLALIAETRHMSFFNSMAAITMISEYLLTLMTVKRSDYYRKRAQERDSLTEDLLLR